MSNVDFVLDEHTAKAIIADKSLNNAKIFAKKIINSFKSKGKILNNTDIKRFRKVEEPGSTIKQCFSDAMILVNNELEKLI